MIGEMVMIINVMKMVIGHETLALVFIHYSFIPLLFLVSFK